MEEYARVGEHDVVHMPITHTQQVRDHGPRSEATHVRSEQAVNLTAPVVVYQVCVNFTPTNKNKYNIINCLHEGKYWCNWFFFLSPI
jgi:hypothetical protein